MLTPKKRPKTPYWVLRGTIDGKRVEVSRKWTTAAEARRAIPAILAEHTADQAGDEGLNFRQAARLYTEAKPAARFIEPLLRYFDGMPVKQINKTEMRRAANALYPAASEATLRRQLYTPVKAILNHAAEEELCAPPRFKSPKGGNRRTHFFTPGQVDTLITCLAGEANGFLAPMVTFLFGQGCRMGEAIALDGKDVHLDHKMAILRKTKNGEERRVTLIPRVVAALSTLPTLGVSGPLFRRLDGYPFRDSATGGGQIKPPFWRAVEAVGLDPKVYTPHVCRHTWATWFYAQTRDVLRLQVEGGWKSAEWQRYAKIGTPELGEAARQKGWNFVPAGENRGEPNEVSTGTMG